MNSQTFELGLSFTPSQASPLGATHSPHRAASLTCHHRPLSGHFALYSFWSKREVVVLQILTSTSDFHDCNNYSYIPRVLHACAHIRTPTDVI